jgi:hypothetical protein
VPIRPFLPESQSFDPEDIANMSAAFEAALGKLGLVDRSDPATTAVAKLIIEFAKAGHRDPESLAPLAMMDCQAPSNAAIKVLTASGANTPGSR